MSRTVVAILLISSACATRVDGNSPSHQQVIALPGAPTDGMFLDYIAYDRANQRVWVPAGATGNVDVIDAKTLAVHPIDGFATRMIDRRGKPARVGPSAATVGDGVVYIGNRGDSSICAVDAATLTKGACAKLDETPDAVSYVAATKEVWVTTPRAKSIVIIDAATLTIKTKITFDGEPEGYAVDDKRGVFYTNLEDRDRTLAIDLQTHVIRTTWLPGCGEDGPKGLALDAERGFLFVACTDRIKVLDAAHDGKMLSQARTGEGVDNLDYRVATRAVYAGAGRAGMLTIVAVDTNGQFGPPQIVATPKGARNAVVTDEGVAFLTSSALGAVIVVKPDGAR